MSVISLARDLIEIPSPSGEEQAIGEFLVRRLEGAFTVSKQPVGGRFNVLAVRGTPKLLLTTHMDTVPGQLPVSEDEQYLYGRGACDTKGTIAAMICAAEEAAAQGMTGFGMLFDVSEETDFSGVAVALKAIDPEFVVVGEPTGLRVATAQKGLLGVRIRCVGKAAPGATPEQGVSAIGLLVSALGRLQRLPLPEGLAGETTMNIGLVSGGVAVNVVADAAEASVEFRTVTRNAEVLRLIESVLEGAVCEVQCSFEPVLPTAAPGFGPGMTVPFFTEMHFWAQKCSTIVLGPGEYPCAHTNDERVPKGELEKAKELYFGIIKSYAS